MWEKLGEKQFEKIEDEKEWQREKVFFYCERDNNEI